MLFENIYIFEYFAAQQQQQLLLLLLLQLQSLRLARKIDFLRV